MITLPQVVEFLAEQDLNHELAGEKTVVVSLPGVNKQFVNVALTVGETIFKIENVK